MKKENEEIIVEIKLVDEISYQQFKKKMCKNDNYFTLEDWKKLVEKINTFLTL